MAFKPFDFFRITTRRGRMMMAGLVLVAMFSFILIGVLPSPGGEGSAVGNWFRRTFGNEPKVFTVDGEGYGLERTRNLVADRTTVFDFLERYFPEAQSRVYQLYGKTAADSGGGEAADRANKERDEKVREMFQSVSFRVAIQRFENLRNNLLQNPNDGKAVEMAEFAYYLKKADELGIVVPAGKVKEDLLKASAGTIKDSDLPNLLRQWEIKRSVDTVMEALANEIRAAFARTVLEAPDKFKESFMSQSPPFSVQATPRDLWESWINLKTDLDVSVVDFPSEAFADSVTLPDTAKLKEYFDRYKTYVADPAKSTPGFRTPKKYELEFVYADVSRGKDGGARAYYQEKADQMRTLRLLASPFPIKIDEKIVHVGPTSVAVPVWIGLEMYGRYQPEFDFLDPKPKKSKYRIEETAESYFGGGTKLADGSIYQLPPGMAADPKLNAKILESLNAAQSVLTVAGGITQPFNQKMVAAGLTAIPSPHRVHRELPIDLPFFAGAVAAGDSLLPATLMLLRDDLAPKFRPIKEVYAEMMQEDADDLVRELLNEDMNKLEQNLRIYSLAFEGWQARKKVKNPKVPVPEEAPLFRDQFQDVKAFDILVNEGPDILARNQGLPKSEPLDAYLQNWAATRNIQLISKKDFGKPRTKTDFLKAETEKTPINSLLKPLFLALDEKGRKVRPTEPIDVAGGEFDKLLIECLIGDRLIAGMPSSEDPTGGRMRPVPSRPYDAKGAMSLSLRKMQGDQSAIFSPFFKMNQAALFWKSNELEEATPLFTDEGVQADVEKAWKLEHARGEAKKAADAFLAKVQKSSPEAGLHQDIKDFMAQYPDRVKESLKIARYETRPGSTGFGEASYTSAKPNTFFHHPKSKLIEDALTQLQKPGDGTVVENEPKNHYYVIVARNRREPDLKSFDEQLISAPRDKRIMVNGRPYGEWVLDRKSKEYAKEWNDYLVKKIGFDPNSDLGKALLEMVRR